MIHFDLSEGMGNCKMLRKNTGKSQGILKLILSGNPGQRITLKLPYKF